MHFLEFDMQHRAEWHGTWGLNKSSDMTHSHFLKSTCDIKENELQRHATLPFIEIDMPHWGPPLQGLRNAMRIYLLGVGVWSCNRGAMPSY